MPIFRSQRVATVTMAVALACAGSLTSANPSRAASADVVPATFTFSGSGWGHGVGLSQYGAYGMALNGFTANQIVGAYFPTTAVTVTSDLPETSRSEEIRVGLKRDVTHVALRGESLGGAGGHLTITADTKAAVDVAMNAAVSIDFVDGKAQITYPNGDKVSASHIDVTWNGTTANGAAPSVVNLVSDTSPANATAGLGTACTNYFATPQSRSGNCYHRYRYGSLQIDAGAFGDTTADLNVVLTEQLDDEYVNGIGEVPSSWPAATLQAQAIAARSYALATVISIAGKSTSISIPGYTKKVRASCLCQVLPDTSDQNYVGFNKEFASYGSQWTAAVAATMSNGFGKVVTVSSGGVLSVVKTFFSSSTGGFTQPTQEVWGSTLAGFGKVDDHWAKLPDVHNPYASWSVQITQSHLVTQLNTWLTGQKIDGIGVQIADIDSLTLGVLTASGAISQFTVTDSGGTSYLINVRPGSAWQSNALDITPDNFRSLMGLGSLVGGPNTSFNGSTYITSITPGSTTTPASPKTAIKKLTRVAGNKWVTSVTLPHSFSVAGMLTPIQSGTAVTLQRKTVSGWVDVVSTTSTKSGTWSLTWKNTQAGNHTLRVRATNNSGSLTTGEHQVVVAGKVTLKAPLSVRVKRSVTLTGAVSPVKKKVTITIDKKLATGKWLALGTAMTNSRGAWTYITQAPSNKQVLELRVRINDTTIGSATSTTARVTVN
ncbi:MAG: SpoIID/LytB domain-containing protein [Actinomycetes bacterium]